MEETFCAQNDARCRGVQNVVCVLYIQVLYMSNVRSWG